MLQNINTFKYVISAKDNYIYLLYLFGIQTTKSQKDIIRKDRSMISGRSYYFAQTYIIYLCKYTKLSILIQKIRKSIDFVSILIYNIIKDKESGQSTNRRKENDYEKDLHC